MSQGLREPRAEGGDGGCKRSTASRQDSHVSAGSGHIHVTHVPCNLAREMPGRDGLGGSPGGVESPPVLPDQWNSSCGL